MVFYLIDVHFLPITLALAAFHEDDAMEINFEE